MAKDLYFKGLHLKFDQNMLNPASILLIPDQTRLAMALSVPRPKHQVSGRYTDLMP